MNDATCMMKLTLKGWIRTGLVSISFRHITKRRTTPYTHIRIIIICWFQNMLHYCRLVIMTTSVSDPFNTACTRERTEKKTIVTNFLKERIDRIKGIWNRRAKSKSSQIIQSSRETVGNCLCLPLCFFKWHSFLWMQ